jgi:hypothetical protein
LNFLALCRRAAVECGVASGTAIQTALPTVVGATGSLGRICGWVSDAWSDIQMDHDDWDFMRSSVALGSGVSFQTIAGQASYPLGVGPGTVGVAVDSFGKWDRETFRCMPTAAGFVGEGFLDEVPFDVWRDQYFFGAQRSVRTQPGAVAVGPDQSLCLGPPPNALYTVTADYFAAPTDMALDADIPVGLPTRFHTLIVYRAMAKYAGYEAAPEVAQRAAEENASMYAQLLAVRAPRMSFGGALA